MFRLHLTSTYNKHREHELPTLGYKMWAFSFCRPGLPDFLMRSGNIKNNDQLRLNEKGEYQGFCPN